MNSFATEKLVNMNTQENHKDDTYILEQPQAQFLVTAKTEFLGSILGSAFQDHQNSDFNTRQDM